MPDEEQQNKPKQKVKKSRCKATATPEEWERYLKYRREHAARSVAAKKEAGTYTPQKKKYIRAADLTPDELEARRQYSREWYAARMATEDGRLRDRMKLCSQERLEAMRIALLHESPEARQIRLQKKRDRYAAKRATGWVQKCNRPLSAEQKARYQAKRKAREEAASPEAAERRRIARNERQQLWRMKEALEGRTRGLPFPEPENDAQRESNEAWRAAHREKYHERVARLRAEPGKYEEMARKRATKYQERKAAGLVPAPKVKADYSAEEWQAILERRLSRRRELHKLKNPNWKPRAVVTWPGMTPDQKRLARNARSRELDRLRGGGDPWKYQDQHPAPQPIKRLALNDETYAAIWKEIGFNHERDEIASEAYLALLEGEATDVKTAVIQGKRRHYRLFSVFRVNLSMDEPRLTDGNKTLHDVIAAYVPEEEPDEDEDAPDPDVTVGDLGQLMIAAYRRSEAVRQAA